MKENRDLLSENTLLEYWNKGGFCFLSRFSFDLRY